MKALPTVKELDYRVPNETPEQFEHDLNAYREAIFFVEGALEHIETTANEDGEAFNAIEEALDLLYAELDEMEKVYENAFPLRYRAWVKDIEARLEEMEWAVK